MCALHEVLLLVVLPLVHACVAFASFASHRESRRCDNAHLSAGCGRLSGDDVSESKRALGLSSSSSVFINNSRLFRLNRILSIIHAFKSWWDEEPVRETERGIEGYMAHKDSWIHILRCAGNLNPIYWRGIWMKMLVIVFISKKGETNWRRNTNTRIESD